MLVRYSYLRDQGIMPNRTQLARSIEQYGFPQPIQLGLNTLAWKLEEVEGWVASRKRLPAGGAADPERAAKALCEDGKQELERQLALVQARIDKAGPAHRGDRL